MKDFTSWAVLSAAFIGIKSNVASVVATPVEIAACVGPHVSRVSCSRLLLASCWRDKVFQLSSPYGS